MMKRRRPEASDSSDNIFALLSDDLDDVYTSFGAVMHQTGLGPLRDEINDAQAMLDASGDLYMELRHAAVVPFDVQCTGDAMWRFLSMAQQEIPNGYMTVRCHRIISEPGDPFYASNSVRCPRRRRTVRTTRSE